MSCELRLACTTLAFALVAACGTSAIAAGDAVMPGGDGKAPVLISAARLEYDSKAKTATYSGNVRAAQGDAHLQCARLAIYMAAKGAAKGGVRRMECFGPVTMTQKDQVGTGDHGTYDKGQNRIILNGHVTLSQGPNISVGDRLVYDLTSGTAQLAGGPTRDRVQGLFEPGSGPTDGPFGAAGKKKPSTALQ